MVPSFPANSAFFFTACRVRQVEAIIESGRQDGYSTEILGRFGQLQGVDVYSIGMDFDPVRATTPKSSASTPQGNAYDEGPSARRPTHGPGHRWLDGPKSWPALSMIAAVAWPKAEVCALHNLSMTKSKLEMRPLKPNGSAHDRHAR